MKDTTPKKVADLPHPVTLPTFGETEIDDASPPL